MQYDYSSDTLSGDVNISDAGDFIKVNTVEGAKVFALGGDDTLVSGGAGRYRGLLFDGGEGNDRVVFGLADRPLKPFDFFGGNGSDTLEISTTRKVMMIDDTSGNYEKFSVHIGAFSVDSVIRTWEVERFVIKSGLLTDTFFGGSGNDYFDGGASTDIYHGSKGNDGYVFDSSEEFVSGTDDGVDTIWTTASQDLNRSAGVENLRLQSGDINATGNALANLITGSAGNNVIAGGAGRDNLYGKGGADTFVFGEFGAANKDSIWDFDQNDKIALSKSAFGALDTDNDGQLEAKALNLTGKAIGTNAQVIYNKTTGTLSYDADGTGSGLAQDVAFIGKNLTYLSADHFSLVA